MALYEDHLEFTVEPPTEAALRERLREVTGDVTGLENYSVQGRQVILNCMLDAYTRSYALQFLTERGGALLDRHTHRPIAVNLPSYVRQPWRGIPWWRRLGITVRYHLGPPSRP